MTRSSTTFRSAFCPAALLLAAWTSGCNPAAGNVADDVPAPIEPSGNVNLAEQWYRGWEKQPDSLAGCEVDDMFFILGTRGRDWREPEGPDGYPVRVCLLDRVGRPIHAAGALHAFLVHAPADPQANRAVCAWSIPQDRAKRRFRKDKIAGYLIQLDWGPNPPADGGDFMLVIRWVSGDGQHRVTRNIVFKDRIRHGIDTVTTRPAAP